MRCLRSAAAMALVLALFGCASYIPPGAKADLDALAPAGIREGFEAKPTAPFPASIAAVRVQSANYDNQYLRNNGGYAGGGKYRVVLVREVEQDVHFETIAKLPQVAGIVTLNRLLVPATLSGDQEIRQAASRLQADLLFLYTFATEFFDVNESRALSTISLGFASTKKINVVTTASALLMDTRSGYIYSAYESTAKSDAKSSVWDSAESADLLRRANEKQAFDNLVVEVTKSWQQMLDRHQRRTP